MAEALKSLVRRRQQRQEPPSPERGKSLLDLCPDHWKRTLKANHPNLRHEIRVKDVLPGFHSFLTDVEYMRVQGSDKADNVDQVDQLVGILLTKEKREFEEFLVALLQQRHASLAARLAEEAGIVLNTSNGMATAVGRDVSLAARAGIPKSHKDAMKEKGLLYYPLIKSLHKAFYKRLIIPFEVFVMDCTDVDFQRLRRVCEQVIRGEEHPIACKIHLPTQREQFLDDLQHIYGLWKDALEYRLLREVIMEFQDEDMTLRLKQYEVLLRENGNTILMECQLEIRRCPDLCLELKAEHNTALSTLHRLKSFLVNDVGLKDTSFAGFREGCIELFFQSSIESASTALDPLCSHAFRTKLLSMGVRRVTLSGHWVINTDTGHVDFLQSPERLTDHDTKDSTADVTQVSEMTESIAGHSGGLSDLEDVPPCKKVKLNPEEEDPPVFWISHNIEWQTAQKDPYSFLLQSESSRSYVADKGTSGDEETMEDGMFQPACNFTELATPVQVEAKEIELRRKMLENKLEHCKEAKEMEGLHREEAEEMEELRREVLGETEKLRRKIVYLLSPLPFCNQLTYTWQEMLGETEELRRKLIRETEGIFCKFENLWSLESRKLMQSESAMLLEEQWKLKLQLHAVHSVGSAKCRAARRKRRRCRSTRSGTISLLRTGQQHATLPDVEPKNSAMALRDPYSRVPCPNLGVDKSVVSMSVSNLSQYNSEQLQNSSVENPAPTSECLEELLPVSKHGSAEQVQSSDNEGYKQSLTLEDEGSCTLRMQQSAGSQDVALRFNNTQVSSDAQSEDNGS